MTRADLTTCSPYIMYKAAAYHHILQISDDQFINGVKVPAITLAFSITFSIACNISCSLLPSFNITDTSFYLFPLFSYNLEHTFCS